MTDPKFPKPVGYVTEIDDGRELFLVDEDDVGIALYTAPQIDAFATAAVLRERAKWEQDAKRYRFLRDNPHFQIEYTGELTLDEHIDAAIRNQKS